MEEDANDVAANWPKRWMPSPLDTPGSSPHAFDRDFLNGSFAVERKSTPQTTPSRAPRRQSSVPCSLLQPRFDFRRQLFNVGQTRSVRDVERGETARRSPMGLAAPGVVLNPSPKPCCRKCRSARPTAAASDRHARLPTVFAQHDDVGRCRISNGVHRAGAAEVRLTTSSRHERHVCLSRQRQKRTVSCRYSGGGLDETTSAPQVRIR